MELHQIQQTSDSLLLCGVRNQSSHLKLSNKSKLIPQCHCLASSRAEQVLISWILSQLGSLLLESGMMPVLSASQKLNLLPSTSFNTPTRLVGRPSPKGKSNRSQHQKPVLCRASAAVSAETLANGKLPAAVMQGSPQQPCAAGRLTDDGTAFLEEHRIRGYEVGPDQKTTIVTIANLLQVCII